MVFDILFFSLPLVVDEGTAPRYAFILQLHAHTHTHRERDPFFLSYSSVNWKAS